MEDFVGGLALGIVGGIVAWLATQTLFRPKIGCSTWISRVENSTAPCGYLYRLKIKNLSYFRTAVDFQLMPRVYFTHTDPSSGRRTSRNIPLNGIPDEVFRLRPRDHTLVTVSPSQLRDTTTDRLRHWGYSLADNEAWLLEDLLSLPRSFFSIRMRFTDSWTGVTRSWESPRIHLNRGGIVDLDFRNVSTRADIAIHQLATAGDGLRSRMQRSRLPRLFNPEFEPENI